MADRQWKQKARAIAAIAHVTFLELLRDKVLYNLLLCGVLVFGGAFLAARVSFVQPARILADFGLSALNLSCSALAVFLGASLLPREFERRTIYVALAHPITRGQFLLGKYAGLGIMLLLNWGLLCAGFMAAYFTLTEVPSDLLSPTWYAGLGLALLQALFVAAISVFFSSFTTLSLAIVLTLGTFLVGTNVTQLRFVAAGLEPGVVRLLLDAIATVWPNFENFSVGTDFSYLLPVSPLFLVGSCLYGLTGIGVFVGLSAWLVRYREL